MLSGWTYFILAVFPRTACAIGEIPVRALYWYGKQQKSKGYATNGSSSNPESTSQNISTSKLDMISQKDLRTLHHIAENRPRWTALIDEIGKIAEAVKSDDSANRRP
ncbi:hypothetical protein ElyMa_003972900 [Elysia marginata]|uniref:Uncharacterized protein n=1 Tax=Elysia marginata TaxID=1093978 RepID=A0AAV4FVV4_9GAST|nr:hypothetical protein ElyMa_003972900 [Elysia marginata]